jgi:hypothetical protein
MDKKLSLSMNQDIIESAKVYAKSNKIIYLNSWNPIWQH